MRRDCANSGGSRTAQSRSNTAGRKGAPNEFAEVTAEFVKRKPDVIVTYGGAALVLKQATASIPIVFAIAIDPLGAGLVQNLSRPGGNITGLSLQQTESSGRRLEVLRDVVPGLYRFAIMFDGGYRASVGENEAVQAIAHKLGLEAVPYEIRRPEDIATIFDALKGRVDALYVVGNAAGARVTNSAAYFRASSVSLAQRTSIRRWLPSVQPNCCNAWRNAAMRDCPSASSAARFISTPTRGANVFRFSAALPLRGRCWHVQGNLHRHGAS